jgi:hypothetical protein
MSAQARRVRGRRARQALPAFHPHARLPCARAQIPGEDSTVIRLTGPSLVLRQGGEAAREAFRASQLYPAVNGLLEHPDWQYWTDSLPRWARPPGAGAAGGGWGRLGAAGGGWGRAAAAGRPGRACQRRRPAPAQRPAAAAPPSPPLCRYYYDPQQAALCVEQLTAWQAEQAARREARLAAEAEEAAAAAAAEAAAAEAEAAQQQGKAQPAGSSG